MKKTISLCLILFCTSLLKSAVLLPAKEVFKPLKADLTYPAFHTRYTLPVNGKNLAEINMGTEFGLVRFNFDDSFLQFGIMGGVGARFDISRITNDLQIADYTLAFPLDYVRGWWVLRLVYWHTSSHIGDDYIKSNGITPVMLEKNVTDDIRLMSAFDIFENFRVYQGYSYSFNTIPNTDKPHGIYWGFDFAMTLNTNSDTSKKIFFTPHIQALEHLGWQPSFCARTGINLEGKKSAVNIFVQFFAGHLTYLGFANKKETSWSMGLDFRL